MKNIFITALIFAGCHAPKQDYTDVIIKNKSKEDSVKVWVTLQSPNSVVGLFGIQDTVGSCSKGYFYAYKDSSYHSNTGNTLLGVVVSFGADNLPCQVAVQQGYSTGINIFECSINTGYEVFDISCEDGINSILKVSVSDTLNWSTGDGDQWESFKSAQNRFPIQDNMNIRGVFPYRCTDCVDTGTAVPQNCFNIKDACNTYRTCQVARTGHRGGDVVVEYFGAIEIAAKK